MHPDSLFSVSDSISTSELWELLSVEERNKFLGTIKDPQSGPAKELLRSVELDIGSVLPWWDADESIPSISSKRYGKIGTIARPVAVGPQVTTRGLRERRKNRLDCATTVWIVRAGRPL